MNYIEALNFMTKKQSLGIMPGLSRIIELLNDMGNPQDKLSIIHVAGTNGKGTVAGTIALALMRVGYKVGLFTSPWVEDYREQIQINSKPIGKTDFTDYVEKYRDNPCSEFEFLTAIMYKYFADSGVDYAVVECGLGGEEDATNVERKNLSVITSISVDHTNFLGNTLEEIALAKSGIIKENCTCVLYPNADTQAIFEEQCKRKNAALIKVKDCHDFNENNLLTAKKAIEAIGVEANVTPVRLPARQEYIGGVLLDGGHNFSAAQGLAERLNDEVAVIGMMKDKDVDGYLSLVASRCRSIIAVTPDNPRALPASELAELAKRYCSDVKAVENPLEAIRLARENGLSLVCGSFFLARQVRKELSAYKK